jgi:Cu+-exporting ATPase
MLTGESMPVEKGPGDTVTVRRSTRTALVIEAGKVGADTVLAQIVAMVPNAGDPAPRFKDCVDSVSAVFVPTVVGVAILAFVIWMIFRSRPRIGLRHRRAVSVLITASPMRLAGISITTAAGRGAQGCVLIKDAEALERMADAIRLLSIRPAP